MEFAVGIHDVAATQVRMTPTVCIPHRAGVLPCGLPVDLNFSPGRYGFHASKFLVQIGFTHDLRSGNDRIATHPSGARLNRFA
jgi:hypothetical protein